MVNSMNKTSLSALYRRLTAIAATSTLDADDCAAAAEGTLAADRREGVAQALAGSPRDAKVVRMLRDLKSDSEALAFGVARTQRDAAHRTRETHRRVAAGHRFGGTMRWATAMAACLVAVVGVWTLRHAQTHAPATRMHQVAKADEISRFGMEGPAQQRKTPIEGDRLFRADFSGG
jgi:hypothetical protein